MFGSDDKINMLASLFNVQNKARDVSFKQLSQRLNILVYNTLSVITARSSLKKSWMVIHVFSVNLQCMKLKIKKSHLMRRCVQTSDCYCTCWVRWEPLSHRVWWRQSIPGLFYDWRTHPLSETPPTGTYCVKKFINSVWTNIMWGRIMLHQSHLEQSVWKGLRFATWSGPCYRRLAACRRHHGVHRQLQGCPQSF